MLYHDISDKENLCNFLRVYKSLILKVRQHHSNYSNMKAVACIITLGLFVATSEAKSFFKLSFGQTKAKCPVVSTKDTFDIEAVS